jgi:hypothetical protein
MKSLIIELRYDDNENPEIDGIIMPAAKIAAKHLFTVACLIAGKRRPQIALRTSDMFVAEEEISLAEDIPEATSEEVDEATGGTTEAVGDAGAAIGVEAS